MVAATENMVPKYYISFVIVVMVVAGSEAFFFEKFADTVSLDYRYQQKRNVVLLVDRMRPRSQFLNVYLGVRRISLRFGGKCQNPIK